MMPTMHCDGRSTEAIPILKMSVCRKSFCLLAWNFFLFLDYRSILVDFPSFVKTEELSKLSWENVSTRMLHQCLPKCLTTKSTMKTLKLRKSCKSEVMWWNMVRSGNFRTSGGFRFYEGFVFVYSENCAHYDEPLVTTVSKWKRVLAADCLLLTFVHSETAAFVYNFSSIMITVLPHTSLPSLSSWTMFILLLLLFILLLLWQLLILLLLLHQFFFYFCCFFYFDNFPSIMITLLPPPSFNSPFKISFACELDNMCAIFAFAYWLIARWIGFYFHCFPFNTLLAHYTVHHAHWLL